MNHTPVIAVLCAAAGLLCGRLLHSRDATSSTARGNSTSVAAPHRTGRAAPPADPGQPRDLAALKKYHLRIMAAGDPVIRRQLERLGAPALRERVLGVLDVVMTAYATTREEDDFDVSDELDLLGAVLRELEHREGIAVLDWIAALPDEHQRNFLATYGMRAAIAGNPAAAAAWKTSHDGETTEDPFFTVGNDVVLSAARIGVDAVLDVCRSYDVDSFNGPFPDDFDFAALHAGLAAMEESGQRLVSRNLEDFMTSWAARDKEPAWKAAINSPHADPSASKILFGAIAAEGEAEGVRWYLERVREAPEDKRPALLLQLNAGGVLTLEGTAVALGGLTEGERGRLASDLIGDPSEDGKIITILESLPRQEILRVISAGYDPEERKSGIPGVNEGKIQVSPYDADEGRQILLRRLTERFQLTPEELEKR